ncbi:uncharacterized protein EI97DRAFT_435652 [Westerdykella ornata]|uniref:Uncharacterized protein n=1 Tax=Westerdykella ornata TaxID=318751 RepID=A0A6A6JBL3_WESOR|nr:uncharacterized protein EI97DRAFT_435652 [Westerdykella ornata]KAF2274000.1 hypothetical protein EI97DRAFT_435652 [Westerdykella ornata]
MAATGLVPPSSRVPWKNYLWGQLSHEQPDPQLQVPEEAQPQLPMVNEAGGLDRCERRVVCGCG